MSRIEEARDTLDVMLGYLGFVVEVEIDGNYEGEGLQVHTGEADLLIGRNGERLDDIQYLLNRLLRKEEAKGQRIRVDVEHYRTMQEDDLVKGVQEMADVVRRTGRSVRLQPMNSYHRRLVHNAFKDDPAIQTWSPSDSARVKRITLMRRKTTRR